MADDAVTVVQLCSVCGTQVGMFSVKKENMMLTTSDRIWCSHCQAEQPEIRGVAGRRTAILTEEATLPRVDAS